METKRFFASRWGMIAAGAAIGLMAALLQLPSVGNPPNMGLCMVCFPRDIAGAIGLHRVPVVQYLRPEIHLGTYPQATVRLSPCWSNTQKDVESAIRAVRAVAKSP